MGLADDRGHVIIASVTPDGPAASVVSPGEVLLSVNNVAVSDAQVAVRLVATATGQSTSTGKLLPVQLILGKMVVVPQEDLESPKGIEADFRLDMIQPREARVMEDPRMPPPSTNEVV